VFFLVELDLRKFLNNCLIFMVLFTFSLHFILSSSLNHH